MISQRASHIDALGGPCLFLDPRNTDAAPRQAAKGYFVSMQ